MMRRITSGMRSLIGRLRRDGVAATWRWLHGHAWPCFSGIPALRFGRVADGVFIGPQIGRRGQRHLRRLGVLASVNLRAEFDDVAAGVAFPDHLRLPTVDGEAPTLEQLAAGVAFIGWAVRSGGVYIHCQSGVGRAPTLAVAYRISTGDGLTEAVDHVRRVRPFVEMTPVQMEQLARFAALWGGLAETAS